MYETLYTWRGGGGGLKKCTVCTNENVDIFGWPLSTFETHLSFLQTKYIYCEKEYNTVYF